MDETMTSVEQIQDQGDAFLEGWDDAEPADTPEDQPEAGDEAQSGAGTDGQTTQTGTGAETKPEEAQKAQGPETTDTPARQGAAEGQEGQKDTAPQTWSVKHMGEARTLTAKDITPELLQKGLDYDRVREKYDEQKPVMEMFSQFAQKAGMTVTEYVRLIRTEAAKAAGMSEAEAKRTVELEDREAAVQGKEAERLEAEKAASEQKARTAREIAEFEKAFPEVYDKAKADPKGAIPQSVWDDVNRGMTLTTAYSKYAVAQAQAEAKAARERAETDGKNAENAARSTGSMKTAGADAKSKDPFLEGWGD